MPKKTKRYASLMALKGRIRERGTSYRELSESIGIAIPTLSDKINGFYAMDLPEAEKIAEFLDIPPLEIPKFFFPNVLRNSKIN